MALQDRYFSTPRSSGIAIYLAILAVAAILIGGASAIWLATDDSGTNVLATDPSSTSPPSPTTPTP
jgi:hypothetical protein